MSPVHGAGELRSLRQDLARIPEQLRPELRRAMREVGQQVRDAAAANASWSTQIPGALQLRTAFEGRRTGVTVVAALGRARHARVYEGLVRDPFRHPVYGDRSNWVAQAARPYLLPAVEQKRDEAVTGVLAAIDTVLARNGFGR